MSNFSELSMNMDSNYYIRDLWEFWDSDFPFEEDLAAQRLPSNVLELPENNSPEVTAHHQHRTQEYDIPIISSISKQQRESQNDAPVFTEATLICSSDTSIFTCGVSNGDWMDPNHKTGELLSKNSEYRKRLHEQNPEDPNLPPEVLKRVKKAKKDHDLREKKKAHTSQLEEENKRLKQLLIAAVVQKDQEMVSEKLKYAAEIAKKDDELATRARENALLKQELQRANEFRFQLQDNFVRLGNFNAVVVMKKSEVETYSREHATSKGARHTSQLERDIIYTRKEPNWLVPL